MQKVSAIITTHKREPRIVKRALKSVLAQTWDCLEVIVVDDSPPDYEHREEVRQAVEEAARDAAAEVRYIPHEKCLGACAARNTGLNASSGSIIAYLDDDDEWLSEKTERMMKGFSSESVALVYCDNYILNEKTGEQKKVVREKHRGRVFESLIRGNYVGSTSFPLIRRDALLEIGGFDPEMQSGQDADVWLRLSERYDFEYVEEPLVIYHQHEGEQITKDPWKKIAGMERVIAKYRDYIDSHPDIYWAKHMKLIPFYLMAGEKKKAKAIWKDCSSRCPKKRRGNLRYRAMIWFGK